MRMLYENEEIKENLLGLLVALFILFSSSIATAYTLAWLNGGLGVFVLGLIAPIFAIAILVAALSVLAVVYFSLLLILWFLGVRV